MRDDICRWVKNFVYSRRNKTIQQKNTFKILLPNLIFRPMNLDSTQAGYCFGPYWTSLWPLMSVCRSVGWSIGWSVGLSSDFLKGREIILPYSYRSTCLINPLYAGPGAETPDIANSTESPGCSLGTGNNEMTDIYSVFYFLFVLFILWIMCLGSNPTFNPLKIVFLRFRFWCACPCRRHLPGSAFSTPTKTATQLLKGWIGLWWYYKDQW